MWKYIRRLLLWLGVAAEEDTCSSIERLVDERKEDEEKLKKFMQKAGVETIIITDYYHYSGPDKAPLSVWVKLKNECLQVTQAKKGEEAYEPIDWVCARTVKHCLDLQSLQKQEAHVSLVYREKHVLEQLAEIKIEGEN